MMSRRKPFSKCVLKEMQKGLTRNQAKDKCKKEMKNHDSRQT
jgi:hypothetical protein